MTGPGLLPLVRRWWWLLLAGAVVGAVAAYIVATNTTKTYQAEAKLLVGPVSGDYPTLQASGALGRTYAELAHSRRVVLAAADQAHVKLTRDQIDNAVTASSNDVTRIIDLQASHQDRRAAARLAGAVASQLIQLRARAPIENVDPVDAIMRDPGLESLKPKDLRTVRKVVLHALGSPNAGDIEVIQAPIPPDSAASPRVGLLVMLGALAGLLITTLYALIRDSSRAAATAERDGDDYDSFILEEFMPAAPAATEREDPESWLERARGRELP
jgi:capsular polysaccharide biosynthesis protein